MFSVPMMVLVHVWHVALERWCKR